MKKEIRQHFARVADLGCILTSRPNPTLHHAHGGSMRGLVFRGKGQKVSDWLVIPLDAELHTGGFGIDAGQPWLTVDQWETMFAPQAQLLDEVSRRIGYNVWRRAGVDRHVEGLSNGEDTLIRLDY